MPTDADADTNATFSGFELQMAGGARLFARYVLWAGGEFQHPKRPPIPGASLGVHSSTVSSWANITSTTEADRDRMLVVGGARVIPAKSWHHARSSGWTACLPLRKLMRRGARR